MASLTRWENEALPTLGSPSTWCINMLGQCHSEPQTWTAAVYSPTVLDVGSLRSRCPLSWGLWRGSFLSCPSFWWWVEVHLMSPGLQQHQPNPCLYHHVTPPRVSSHHPNSVCACLCSNFLFGEGASKKIFFKKTNLWLCWVFVATQAFL